MTYPGTAQTLLAAALLTATAGFASEGTHPDIDPFAQVHGCRDATGSQAPDVAGSVASTGAAAPDADVAATASYRVTCDFKSLDRTPPRRSGGSTGNSLDGVNRSFLFN